MLKIKDIKKIDTSKLNNRCKFDIWYAGMIEKSVDELTIKDIYYMLSQKVFLDIVVPKCWEELKKNPLVGENYEGQFLEILLKALKENKQYIDKKDYEEFMEVVGNYPFEFEDDIEKKEYESKLEELSFFIQINNHS